jgi:uncharacterized protein (TIGR02118 family)
MSVALLVIYEIEPEDPQAFWDYYLGTHIPLAKKFPNLKRVEIDKGVDGDIFLMTRLIYDNLEDLKASADSPEREKAKADMAQFPALQGQGAPRDRRVAGSLGGLGFIWPYVNCEGAGPELTGPPPFFITHYEPQTGGRLNCRLSGCSHLLRSGPDGFFTVWPRRVDSYSARANGQGGVW